MNALAGNRTALIERLREGPVSQRDNLTGITTPLALKVQIHKLRAAGYVIESEPDPSRLREDGEVHGKARRYRLISEPEPLDPDFDETKGLS